MTRHLVFPVLISTSGELSQIASRCNNTAKFFNSLLNTFIQIVKINENFAGDISKRSAMCSFHSPMRRINVKANSS